MMKIADALKTADISKLAAHTVKVGDVYEITMNEANGIRPKEGDDYRNKYFIVLGFDPDGTVYGGVIINSRINRNLPAHIRMYHMPIRQAKYPFLRYDSFVDCVRLKTASPQKFNEWSYLGKVDKWDIDLIIGTIKESPVESKENLMRFRLL